MFLRYNIDISIKKEMFEVSYDCSLEKSQILGSLMMMMSGSLVFHRKDPCDAKSLYKCENILCQICPFYSDGGAGVDSVLA